MATKARAKQVRPSTSLDSELPEEDAPKAKRAKVSEMEAEDLGRPALLEDLEIGTEVLFWETRRGSIHEAIPEMDTFWVVDGETGQVVHDDATGKIYDFKSSELLLVAPSADTLLADLAAEDQPQQPQGGLLLLGTEKHMMEVLNHFGSPSFTERQTPSSCLLLSALIVRRIRSWGLPVKESTMKCVTWPASSERTSEYPCGSCS